MALLLTVAVVVGVSIALVGVAAYLIDKMAERHDPRAS
jgi:hypothetical protein